MQRDARLESHILAQYLAGKHSRCSMLTWILVLCAALGFLISLYFTLVYYQLMAPDAKLIPSVCQLSEQTCQTILSTREARMLAIPNFLLGLLYYLALMILGAMNLVGPSVRGYDALLIISVFTVFLGLYLTHSLLSKLRVVCVLCLASHAINLIIAVLLFSIRFG
ncbi:MAG: vitamin K epoxide reductase family protein [Bacteroidota bacterium]